MSKVQYFLKLTGIDGDSQTVRYHGWFEAENMVIGTGRGALAAWNKITLTLPIGAKIQNLSKAISAHQTIGSGEVDLVYNGQLSARIFLQNVTLNALTTNGSGQIAGRTSQRVFSALTFYAKLGFQLLKPAPGTQVWTLASP